MTETADKIPTHLRALRIAEAVAEDDAPVSQSALAERLGLAKQTVNRLCRSMVSDGFLVTEDGGKRLRPGRRLRAMASGLLDSSRFHIARRQIMRALSAEIGETVNFVVPGDDGMIYQDRVETAWALRIQLPIGSHVPFHCTASGKVFLASLPPQARRTLVRSLTLSRHTARTLTDAQALLAELADAAQAGFARDDEEFIEGMVAIAAPVRDARGRYVASLAFHGPTQRLSMAEAIARREALFAAAARIEETLGL